MASQSIWLVPRMEFPSQVPCMCPTGFGLQQTFVFGSLAIYTPQTGTARVLYIQPLQDWYNTAESSAIRSSWVPGAPCPLPWKRNFYSPLRTIPGGDCTWRIRIDPAHTYAIQGFGSLLASSTCILLCRLRVVEGGSMNACLEQLYLLFKAFCRGHGKTTSLPGLSMKKFKMASRLDLGKDVLKLCKATLATHIIYMHIYAYVYMYAGLYRTCCTVL